MIEKLKSRKFLAMLLGIAMGIALSFGVDGDTVTTVAGAVMSLVSLVTYIYTEGKIDAAAVFATVEAIQEAVSKVEKQE